MIALLQRVSSARVVVAGETRGAIRKGVLAFIGVQRGDDETRADRLLTRILGYRMFEDRAGRMNLGLQDAGGGLLLVPQFTLAADTRKGMRPSFTPAAEPALGRRLYGYLLQQAQRRHGEVASGVFGAHMEVHLVNDGPVTFWLEAPPAR